MKKISSLLLTLCLLCCLAACDSQPEGTEPPATKTIYVRTEVKITLNGGQCSVTRYIYNEEGGIMTAWETYSNDEQTGTMTVLCDQYGRPTRISNNEDPENEYIIQAYNEWGDLTEQRMMSQGEVTTQMLCQYNADGILTASSNTVGGNTFTYEYYIENGVATQVASYLNGALQTTVANTYGQDGKILFAKIYSPSGEEQGWQEYVYDDDAGTVTINNRYDTEEIHSSVVNTYDEYGNLIKTVYTSGGTLIQTTEYTYLAIEIPADCPRKTA